jgi:hypothetical protein
MLKGRYFKMSEKNYVYGNVAVEKKNKDFDSITIPYFLTPEYREEQRREAAREARRQAIIAKKKRELKIKLAIKEMVINILFAAMVALQIAAISYVMMYFGLQEHPAFTQSAVENRILTSLFQGTLISAVMDLFVYNVYESVMTARYNKYMAQQRRKERAAARRAS